MSLRELKQLAKARQIVKDELAKIKINEEGVSPALVKVEYDVALDDAQFNEEKRKLKNNLNQIMTLAQAEEIVNDTNLINRNNIYTLNQTWKRFIEGVTKEFSNLSFDTFKTLLSTFLRRVKEPNEQQAQLNKLAEIVDTLRQQAATVDGLAPKIEQILQVLNQNYIPPEGLDRISDAIPDDRNLTQQDVNLILNLSVDAAENYGYDDDGVQFVDETGNEEIEEQPLAASSGSASSGSKDKPKALFLKDGAFSVDEVKAKIQPKTKVTDIYRTAKRNFSGALEGEASVFANSLLPDDKNQFFEYVDLMGEKHHSRGESNKDYLLKISPYVTSFRNFRAKDLIDNQKLSKEEARQQAEKDSTKLFGYGMKQDKRTRKEQTVPFGVLQLNTDKLKANTLKLTYNNNNMVKEIPATKISDHFKNMVNDILNNKKYSEAKFNKLNDDEKLLYKQMLKKSRLYADLDVRMDSLGTPSIDKLKNEFQVVMGQIEAGNNNPTLLKRAKELIQEFINKKVITKAEGVSMLMQI